MQRLKDKMYQFLGMDLPKRTLPLRFSFPEVSGRFKAANANSYELVRDLEEAKNIPPEYFGLLLKELKYINRCKMKPRQRLRLAREVMKLYYPMAMAQLAKLAQNGGIPEAEDHKRTLDSLVDIAQIMIVSYQIVFAKYYSGGNFNYARARNSVRECASRILELLVLKQHAKSLRYQLLSDQDWQLANTIFHVMNCYEDVGLPLPTLNNELKVGGRRKDACLRDQYALLQTVSKFDMLRWPTHLHWVIGSYFHSIENAVQIKPDDGSAGLGRNELISYCYDTVPARTKRMGTPPGAAVILSFGGLTEAIRKDCMGLLSAKKNNDVSAIPPRFALLPETEHFVISEQLVRGLGNAGDDNIVEKEHQLDELRIFVGFTEVFGFLHHKQGRYGSEDRLADMLAKRSALIAEDAAATQKSVWTLLFKNEEMIRLSTQETSFTTAMGIGSLLAYGVGDEINRPSFAVVSRIFRPTQQVVIIDIQRIADYAEAVAISLNMTEHAATNKASPALLVYDQLRLGGWGLMFPPMDILLGVDQLAVSRNKQIFGVNLKNMCNATDDFYLFSSSLTSEQLGIDGRPAYAVPPAETVEAPRRGW